MSRPGFSLLAMKDGDAVTFDRDRFRELWRRLKDGQYEIAVERFVEGRTSRQNRYYHGVIVKGLAEYWGVDHDDAHELIKQHCNKKTIDVVNKETGEVEEVTIGASTANLNKEEWGLFIERCHQWAATEFGFVIPDADPEYHLHRYETENRPKAKRQAA